MEQHSALVPDFMYERCANTTANHPFAGHLNNSHRIEIATGQPGASPSNGGAVPALQKTNYRGRFVQAYRKAEGILGERIQTCHPNTRSVFGALCQHIGKNVHLIQQTIEP
jgi:hypothetical protein